MRRIIKGALSVLILSMLLAPGAWAQGNYTAASCNQSDVNAVINGPTHTAVNGDIINIPAGSCTWTSGITISGVGITIIGQGTPNVGPSTTGAGTSTTTIIQDTTASLFTATGVPYGQTMRYSLLNLQPYSGLTTESVPIVTVGTCTASGCPNIRVDNIIFASGYDGDPSQAVTIADNLFGVYDHNTDNGSSADAYVGPALAQISHSSWLGVGSYGDNSFASADTFGTAGALYIENNVLNMARATENDVGYSDLGGDREVVRYNVFNNMTGTGGFSSHGTAWSGRDRGSRQKEVYGNTFNCVSSIGCGGGNVISGTGYIFENSYVATSPGFFNNYVGLDVPRAWRGVAPWYGCDGTGLYDQNDGTTYASGSVTTSGTNTLSDSSKSWTTNEWAGSAVTNGTPYSGYDVTHNFGSDISSNTATQLAFNAQPYTPSGNPATWNVSDSYQILRATLCIDQPGRSQGTLLSGATPSPTGWVNEVLDPVYEWADTNSGGFGSPVGVPYTNRLLANRDYYNEVSTSAQSSPTSPFNGTSGTGYGTLANRPTTCTPSVGYWATDQGSWNQSGSGGQGELFVCTATNTWTLYYTPYTYPHPLTSADPLAPPANVQAAPH